MAGIKKPAKSKRIIDVEHPGKSAPASTSKSVIISNRPLLKDPMVNTIEETDDDSNPSGSPAAKPPGKLKTPARTAPLLKPEKPAEPDETADLPDDKAPTIADLAKAAKRYDEPPEPTDDKSEPDQAEKTKPETKSSQSAPEKPKPETPEGDISTKDTPLPEDQSKQADAEAAERAKHEAAIQKLVDDKKYSLPINSVEKRRSKRFVALGILLSLLLAAAWVDIALDAGIIQLNGIKPLTHLFSN